MERSLYWYIVSLGILTNPTLQLSHYSSYKESVVSILFNGVFSVIVNKDDLTKENARIKRVLKKNGYQASIISKIFKRITNNHSLFQWQEQTQTTCIQEEEIRMSINLTYVEGSGEKLQHILKSHKMKSTFHTESTFHKLLCKPLDPVTTEEKKYGLWNWL